ncbi:hypothetical protein EV184_104136 [Sinorhizobium americanum]|uniref:Uncharacterized protein n=1 Tax=Sinorhizobium americanum TaxID=194963 RepID=A0A4V2RFG3_9HYPH|nr:hypothetical protein EV184_104136 [Sinorhizobium americanum]
MVGKGVRQTRAISAALIGVIMSGEPSFAANLFICVGEKAIQFGERDGTWDYEPSSQTGGRFLVRRQSESSTQYQMKGFADDKWDSFSCKLKSNHILECESILDTVYRISIRDLRFTYVSFYGWLSNNDQFSTALGIGSCSVLE